MHIEGNHSDSFRSTWKEKNGSSWDGVWMICGLRHRGIPWNSSAICKRETSQTNLPFSTQNYDKWKKNTLTILSMTHEIGLRPVWCPPQIIGWPKAGWRSTLLSIPFKYAFSFAECQLLNLHFLCLLEKGLQILRRFRVLSNNLKQILITYWRKKHYIK